MLRKRGRIIQLESVHATQPSLILTPLIIIDFRFALSLLFPIRSAFVPFLKFHALVEVQELRSSCSDIMVKCSSFSPTRPASIRLHGTSSFKTGLYQTAIYIVELHYFFYLNLLCQETKKQKKKNLLSNNIF